jgi:hypothetical protein
MMRLGREKKMNKLKKYEDFDNMFIILWKSFKEVHL